MDENLFQIVYLGLRILLIVLAVYLLPPIKNWILANTTPKQRADGVYWLKLAVIVAEDIYKKKGSGLGPLKKEWVLEWLKNNNIKFTEGQADLLIDLVVKYFNENDWPTSIDEILEPGM